MYIADTWNNRIRKVTISTGIITTIAGTGTTTYSGDNGQATNAGLNFPTDVALDSAGTCLLLIFYYNYSLSFCYLGNIYFGDSNNRVHKVTISTGIIITFAGTGVRTYSGDGGAASSAGLNGPVGIALDSAGTHSSLL